MTIATWNAKDSGEEGLQNNNPNIKIVFIGIMVVLAIAALVLFTVSNLNPESSYSSIKTFQMQDLHSIAKHGVNVVDSAMKCLTKYGSFKTFRTFGFRNNTVPPRTSFLCIDIENNESYLIVTTGFKNSVTTIVTIYDVIKKEYPTINSYIEYLKRDWGAFEINYVFSPQKFNIQPFK